MTKLSLPAVLILVASAMLGGCASSGASLDRNAPVSEAKLNEARAAVGSTRASNAVTYRLATAGAAACAGSDPQRRAPFSLLFNSKAIKDSELRTALYVAMGADDKPLLQAHAPSASAYDGAEVAEINGQSAANEGKLMQALMAAVADDAEIRVKLADGRQAALRAVTGCPSLVMTDHFGRLKEALYTGGIVEVTPKAWSQLALNDDERAFILARSVYFTGGEGRVRLRNALLAGAVANGALRALTFSLSMLVLDVKTVAVRTRREANKGDADAFGVQLMALAGYNPAAALAFAERSLAESAAWPSECDELKFDAARTASLKKFLSGPEFGRPALASSRALR